VKHVTDTDDVIVCVSGCRDPDHGPVHEQVHVLTGVSLQMPTIVRRWTIQTPTEKSLGYVMLRELL